LLRHVEMPAGAIRYVSPGRGDTFARFRLDAATPTSGDAERRPRAKA
jgi:hypothetical protein